MKTNKKEKSFDAFKMMREIRDKISIETQIEKSGFNPIGKKYATVGLI